jgi:hypothetical protein
MDNMNHENQKSKLKNQKSKIKNQTSKIKNQKSEGTAVRNFGANVSQHDISNII